MSAQQLRASSTKGNVERVRALLAQGVDANAVDARGNSPLKLAVANGHADVVDALLDGGASVDAVVRVAGLSAGAALFVAAAEVGSAAIIDRLLGALGAEQRAAALRESDASGWSVLHLAAKAGSAHLASLALGAGAPADAVVPGHGATALMVAVQHGRADVLGVLLAVPSAASLVEAADARGWCALHWAAQLGDEPIARALLEAASARALEACADGVGTPLMVAAENAHPAVIEALLARGARVDATDAQGWCALAIASGKGHAQIVSQLLGARADVNQAGTMSRRTPLMAAAQSGHAAVASLLLAARADANGADASGVSALMLSAKNGHAPLVGALLAAGARADAADAAGQTALVLNAKAGDVRIAALLLEHGAHADHVTAAGVSALVLAARHGHRELIELLIKAGTSHAGELLMRTAASAQMDVLLALVKAGGGMIDVDVLGSALLTAAAHGQRSAVSVLVNAGASVFKQDASGLSPLMLASGNGHVDTVRALIKASAPVNAPGGPGANTPLSLAARNGRADVVAELLRHGANVEWRGAGERAPDLLELAHEPQVKAQIVAERQRRALERELLSAKEEASARREKRRGKERANAKARGALEEVSHIASPRSPPREPGDDDADGADRTDEHAAAGAGNDVGRAAHALRSPGTPASATPAEVDALTALKRVPIDALARGTPAWDAAALGLVVAEPPSARAAPSCSSRARTAGSGAARRPPPSPARPPAARRPRRSPRSQHFLPSLPRTKILPAPAS